MSPFRTLLLVVLLLPGARAQGTGDEVVHVDLGAVGSGPRVTTPHGAPVVGGPFGFDVVDGQPGQRGALLLGAPGSGAFPSVLDPTGLLAHRLFRLGPGGRAEFLFPVREMPAALTGLALHAQAVLSRPDLAEGVEWTNAWSLRVGVPPRSDRLFPGPIVDVMSTTGGSLRRFESVDSDGDGHLDLVVAAWPPGDLLVFHGRGDGTHEVADEWPFSEEPIVMTMGLLDGDALPDVVMAGVDHLTALVHTGPRTFAPETVLPLPGNPRGIALGDLDGDGFLDVAVTYSSTVATLLGDGNGSFALPAIITPTPGVDSRIVEIADHDGDGLADVLILGWDSRNVVVLAGAGDGTLSPPSTIDSLVGPSPRSFTATDLDQDGNLDMLVGRADGANLYFGDGSGGYAFETLAFGAIPGRGVFGSVDDVDADGVLDVILGDDIGIGVFAGLGGRRFAPPVRTLIPGGGGAAFGDVDEDGNPDVIQGRSGGVGFHYGDGSLSFGDGAWLRLFANAYQLELRDLTGDAVLDAVAIDATGQTIVLAEGVGDGSFELLQTVALTADPLPGYLGDADGDGGLDLVTTVNSSPGIPVQLVRFPVNAQGTLDVPVVLASPAPRGVVLGADLDVDGTTDLLVVDTSWNVFLGAGAGAFQPLPPIPGAVFSNAAIGDLDRDGIPDLVAVKRNSGDVEVWSGRGDGTFDPPVLHPAGSLSFSGEVALADLDGDGFTDVVTAESTLGVWRGLGDGTLGPVEEWSMGDGEATDLAVGDVDGDGDVDVLATGWNVRVFLGDGEGGFESIQTYGAGGARSGALGDLDGDGVLDIVAADGSLDTLFNLLGEPAR